MFLHQVCGPQKVDKWIKGNAHLKTNQKKKKGKKNYEKLYKSLQFGLINSGSVMWGNVPSCIALCWLNFGLKCRPAFDEIYFDRSSVDRHGVRDAVGS